METKYEEGPETAALLRKLLKKTDLFPEDLARLINVKPATLERWLSGAPVDLGCAHVLFDLIDRYPDAVIFMLAEPESPAGQQTPWVRKLAAIQTRLGLSTTGMVELLNTQYPAFRKWMHQETQPSSCYQALINLLYYNTPRMAELLAESQEPIAESAPWDKRRIQALLARLGMTSGELMELLGMTPSAVSGWIHGSRGPGPCATLFLDLVENSPQRIIKMIASTAVEAAEAWTGDRVQKAREHADLGRGELAEIYGTDHETITKYEREGLPIEKGCPVLFYTLLESRPEEFLAAIARLRA